jgi:hypothetical protein
MQCSVHRTYIVLGPTAESASCQRTHTQQTQQTFHFKDDDEDERAKLSERKISRHARAFRGIRFRFITLRSTRVAQQPALSARISSSALCAPLFHAENKGQVNGQSEACHRAGLRRGASQ